MALCGAGCWCKWLRPNLVPHSFVGIMIIEAAKAPTTASKFQQETDTKREAMLESEEAKNGRRGEGKDDEIVRTCNINCVG